MPISEQLLDAVRAGMRGLQPPGHYDKVYKDECMYSFETPESPGGLYVNLKTYQAFCGRHLALDHGRTGNALYLHIQHTRVPMEEPAAVVQAAPTKLAIGGEGGFQVDKETFDLLKEHTLVLLPGRKAVALPCPELPQLVIDVCDRVLAHQSAQTEDKLSTWEEERRISKYVQALEQLPPTRKISPNPKDWKCDDTGVTENLWLNLSTGHIGSGRQNWDGSGGNGSALRHYEATGKKYPLVVKLGTITPSGADVYSYAADEDDMVEDPLLRQHLAHWGINMMQMEKTEKSMAELQIDLNMAFEFDRITEAGGQLEPLAGPGLVGLVNLGNSCYLNSCVQVLFSIPQVAAAYAAAADALIESAPADPANDLPTQMAKLGTALVEARVPAPPVTLGGVVTTGAAGKAGAGCGGGQVVDRRLYVSPLSFKTLAGKGHPEFSSARQQDAAEFWRHLLELLNRAEHAQASRLAQAQGDERLPTASNFTFQVESRVQCSVTGAVSYKTSEEGALALPIPLEAATNASQVAAYQERCSKRQKLADNQATAYIGAGAEGAAANGAGQDGSGANAGGSAAGGQVVEAGAKESPVLPLVPLAACLEKFAAQEELTDYFSAAAGSKVAAQRTTRFATFPPYLLVQLKRYYVGEDWTPRKLEVEVDVPDTLDLTGLRASGPQPGEQMQPEEPAAGVPAAAVAAQPAPAPVQPKPDALIVSQLVSMGFGENGSKRAALAVNNSSAEAAMEWVFAHMEDAGFNDPLPEPAAAAAGGGGGAAGASAPAAGAAGPDPEALSTLAAMGFDERAAGAALKATGGNLERAADWLFSHMDDLQAAIASVEGGGHATAGAAGDGGGASKVVDGPGRYRLLGFISHMGSNTGCGHYVAHIRRGDRWVIFNDDKVAASAHPPRTLGYMYLYERLVDQ